MTFKISGIDSSDNSGENMTILPHHIGIMMNFYIHSEDIEKYLSDQKFAYNYSDELMRHEKSVYDKIISDGDFTIRVVLEGPDSICYPSLTEKCGHCINSGKYDSDDMSLQLRFERAYCQAIEIFHLLHYPELDIDRQYSPQEFRNILENTGTKINDFLINTEKYESDINPRTLIDYFWCCDDGFLEKQFPLAARFYRSGFYDDIIRRYRTPISSHKINDNGILELTKKYPRFFSGNPQDTYMFVLDELKSVQSTMC